MADFTELKNELTAIKAGVIDLKAKVAALEAGHVLTQAEVDELDKIADDTIAALGAVGTGGGEV